jgi:hypothetical protein
MHFVRRFGLVFSCFVVGCAAQASHPDEVEGEARGTGDLPLGDVLGRR